MLIEWSLLIEDCFFIDVSAFGESLSFGCPKESNQRKGHLAAIALPQWRDKEPAHNNPYFLGLDAL
jgi:hypothetical protein